MESYEILWKSALKELEKTVSSIFFDTFVINVKPVDILGDKLILCTNNPLFKKTVEENTSPKIVDALSKVNNDIRDFEIIIAEDRDDYLKQIGEAEREKMETRSSLINPKFTFDSFVVGSSNEFIYSAAKAVAEQPGDAYNPLFIYGGTGLGKTHILMAIANYLKIHKPSLNVMYATCEQFVNQMVESISKGKGLGGMEFRKKYRNLDVLLIDDVQFLSKKEATQTEFFHTFNELVLQNKQVVLTSDRPPREIEVLEERLRTRFEGGLLADVQQPDLETRIAILRKKADEQKCVIDLKVLAYIAENNEGDIRTLIGKLTKVIFASKLHERPITIELVKDALKESTGGTQEELQVEDIINCVCNFYKISKADMLSKKKNKEFSEPRQICIYLITDMMSLPLVTVGEKIGGRDHATVIYARNKIAEEVKNKGKLATEINDIKKMLLKQ
ncbi:MAG: chromosomal replication initiator protein DnaA [Clostridia bacterium]|nr:chromosomal replication initiator protein DnaA [Clostridia bacterium]